MQRGQFILFEGKDRAGKTTQVRKLVQWLADRGYEVETMAFPARRTALGHLLDEYLKGKHSDIDVRALHLLFTANRLEFEAEMRAKLARGVTLVVDRYAFSGVCYSAAKGVNVKWCESIEAGILRPDLMFVLHCDPEVTALRAGYGEERHERKDFQARLHRIMIEMDKSDYAHSVHEMDVSAMQIDEVHSEILRVMAGFAPFAERVESV